MLRFFPLLVPKGGSFSAILKASANNAPFDVIKEFAILLNQANLRGLRCSDSLAKIEFLDKEPTMSERSRMVPAKKEHILKLMKEMPETIKNWRKDRKLLKEASKPKYPF
ncbi:hypothetical protein MDAP_002196 [Mitosporidium daphniae]|uniref:Uncharacterized protein n=1 Tax=Mitosporidium daphniae TaxID=1485682 RepID=A0A098VVL9_9MICR|nr:uncharacterized protein DI09_119p50 [Mitosporidium daphniae]KGG53002.1 hypothetical protein DI09_119p50 [Mitosporidium daphniae]|eukprot:XP_013239438.1 uncharacterized protein DI09_119p50 [Mitosporidium daphniae]